MKITPHEGKYNYLGGQVCYCDVIDINEDNRSVTVRTLAPPGSKLKDKRISGVKMLTQHATVDGDETGALPPMNSRGVLIFCESQPYILGFFTPDSEDDFGGALTNRVVNVVNQGDQIFANAFGNYIALRNQGLIEIQSTDQLKTFYDPERDFLNTFCQNYELDANGGISSWQTDDTTLNTNLTVTINDNVTPANTVVLSAGFIDGTNVLSILSGPTGAPTFGLQVANAGDVTIGVNGTAKLNIANSGDTTYATQGQISITSQKSGLFSTQQDMTLTSGANVNMQAMQNVIIQCQQFLANAKSDGNKLGAGAAFSIPLGEMLLSALQAMAMSFNTHQHLYVAPLIPLGPDNTSPPLVPMTPPSQSILSKKWQVE